MKIYAIKMSIKPLYHHILYHIYGWFKSSRFEQTINKFSLNKFEFELKILIL